MATPAIPTRVLVAPDSFKGTFRAPEVAAAIGRGLESRGLEPPDLCPVADGGEGTAEILVLALGGRTAGAEVSDPLGRPRRAGFALVEDGGTAVVEVAAASGLALVAEDERDAEAATSRGTGELIAAAVDAGAAGRARRGRRQRDDGRRRRRDRRHPGGRRPARRQARGAVRRAHAVRARRRASSGRRRAPTPPRCAAWSAGSRRWPGAGRATRAASR